MATDDNPIEFFEIEARLDVTLRVGDSEVVERFWSKVDKDGPVGHLGTPCWLWTKALTKAGYGMFAIAKRNLVYAHVYSYYLATGVLVRGHQQNVDHQCYTPACLNPDHLRMITHKQNIENRSGLNKNNTSGVRGVSLVKGKWKARVGHNYQTFIVGTFDELSDAEAAVVAKRLELFTHNDRDRVS